MAKKTLNNSESYGSIRSKINDNFTELYGAAGELPKLWGDFSRYYRTLPVETANLTSQSAGDIYTLYDNLMNSLPEGIITKQLIGYGSDASSNEDTNLPIYEYTFEPPKLNPNMTGFRSGEDFLRDPILILISTGVHGNEKNTIWGTYLFLKNMIEDWQDNEMLASIRANVRFKVVPICNPGGFNIDARRLLNNQDPNREFGNYETQAHPYPEIAALKAWVHNNNNAFAFIDFHNVTGYEYFSSPSLALEHLYGNVIRRLSMNWDVRYDLPDLTKYTAGVARTPGIQTGGTTFKDYAYHSAGIKLSCTLETQRDFGGSDTGSIPNVEKSVELLVNFILAILNNYPIKY